MNWKQAKEYARKGKIIKLVGWSSREYVYYISHSDFCKAFHYGFGEYIGEPSFKGTYAKVTADNQIVVGWKPNKEEKKLSDWTVTGTWKEEEKIYG